MTKRSTVPKKGTSVEKNNSVDSFDRFPLGLSCLFFPIYRWMI